jgi:hypothetical protein
MEQGGGRGWWPLGDSCAIVMRDVIGEVNEGQWLTMWITNGPVENADSYVKEQSERCPASPPPRASGRDKLSLEHQLLFLPLIRCNRCASFVGMCPP